MGGLPNEVRQYKPIGRMDIGRVGDIILLRMEQVISKFTITEVEDMTFIGIYSSCSRAHDRNIAWEF